MTVKEADRAKIVGGTISAGIIALGVAMYQLYDIFLQLKDAVLIGAPIF